MANIDLVSMNLRRIGLRLILGIAIGVAAAAEPLDSLDCFSLFPRSPDQFLTLDFPECRQPLAPRFTRNPLMFEENLGQHDAQVKFSCRAPGCDLFLTATESVFVFFECPKPLHRRTPPFSMSEPPMSAKRQAPSPARVLRMGFSAANPNPSISGDDRLRASLNYYIGNNPSRWRTNISTFEKVRYREIYPGVDLEYYGNEGRIEYDFIVVPSGNPARIALTLEGADKVEVNDQGDLLVSIGAQQVRWLKPAVYQEINGKRVEIAGRYRVESASRGENSQIIHFDLPKYNLALALVIDPVLVYSTYFGGSGGGDPRDFAYGIASDPEGNTYVTGSTRSSDFPVRNAIQNFHGGGGLDAFGAKFSPEGELLYSTYLGGSGDENGGLGGAIATDKAGSAYITGSTESEDFPVLHPFQLTYAGRGDVFVAKLSSDGLLVYSTYLGGPGIESPNAIAVDGAGNSYIGGTAHLQFPVYHALFATNSGGGDAFVAKLAPAGDALIYSTYLGTTSADGVTGLAVDANGNAYISGYAGGTNFPVRNALQPIHAGESFDGFISKISSDGSELLFSTYFGGSGYDQATRLALLPSGDICVAFTVGYNNSPSSDFPLLNALRTRAAGFDEIGLVRLKGDGSAIVFSTLFGGNGEDDPSGIGTDAQGNILLTGETTSTDFPVTNALQNVRSNARTSFITTVASDGSRILFSTFFEPPASPTGTASILGATMDLAGNIYFCGYTDAVDLPVVNSFQSDFAGGFDGFVGKLAGWMEGPKITVSLSGTSIVVAWPASAETSFVLESSESLGMAAKWQPEATDPILIGDQRFVTSDASDRLRFYRLSKR